MSQLKNRNGGIRTRTGRILSPLPLPLGYVPFDVIIPEINLLSRTVHVIYYHH